MDAVDDTWDGPHPTRVFAVGVALGSVVGLLIGSAIGITVGQRSVRAMRQLLEEALRRGHHPDFELLAQ